MPMRSDDIFSKESWQSVLERFKGEIGGMGTGWTDFNPQDPGITILELLVWLSQSQQYHATRIGEHHIKKYAGILGVTPIKRKPGHTLVTVSVQQELEVEAGSRFYAGKICFETRERQMVGRDRFSSFCVESGGDKTVLEGDLIREGNHISLYPFGKKPEVGASVTIELEHPLREACPYRLFLGSKGREGVAYRPVEQEAYDGYGFYPPAGIRMEFESEAGWRRAEVTRDETYGMIQSGCIWFSLPSPMRKDCYRLRFVLERNEYLVPPQITRISLCMVEVWQQETVHSYAEWRGNQRPNQRYELENPDFITDSLLLRAETEAGLPDWSQVKDFDCSGPEDLHFVVEHGSILFGDGVRGKIPAGRIQIGRIVFTLGAGGNSKAGSIRESRLGPGAVVNNEWDVTGGTDEETQESAITHFWDRQCRGHRAVTWADYEELIMLIPGLPIEDCRVYSRNPEQREVTIAVKPYTEDGYGRLNLAYEKNLYRYLEEKRLIGTRLVLVSPEYCDLEVVCVAVGKIQYRNALETVEKEIAAWVRNKKFGEGVRYEELKGMIGTLPCIRHVESLWLNTKAGARRNQFGDILVPPNGIVKLKRVVCNLTQSGGEGRR